MSFHVPETSFCTPLTPTFSPWLPNFTSRPFPLRRTGTWSPLVAEEAVARYLGLAAGENAGGDRMAVALNTVSPHHSEEVPGTGTSHAAMSIS